MTITETIIDAIAWERAPRYPGRSVNRRVVCADGYTLSIQASYMHYANDSTPVSDNEEWPQANAPYWHGEEAGVCYPFITFEIGAVESAPEPAEVWDEYDSGGVWSWVPRQVVLDLLNLHGGVVEWERPK